MNRRQLLFVIVVNAMISLAIALGVVWAFEARRPDPEVLAALYTPQPTPILAAPVGQTPPPPAATSIPTAPAQQEATATPKPAEEEIYIVQAGDSLLAIATRYNVTVEEIAEANNLTNPDFVFSGQRLVIPVRRQAEGSSPAEAAAPTQGVIIQGVEGVGNLEAEAIVIVNESNLAFNLQGWQVVRDGGPTYTFGNLPIFPGGSVRLHTAAGVDSSIDLYWGQIAALWQPGMAVRLLNAQGTEVHRYVIP